MKISKVALISLFIVLLGCDKLVPDQYYMIRVKNNSLKTILSCGAYILPDTILPSNKLVTTKIFSGKSNVILDSQLNDDKLERFKNEKVSIFIIDEQVFNSMTWDSIRKGNYILKR